jgi:outer membrane protein assembly factor BamB
MVSTAAFILWWLFASRLPWKERFIVLGGCAAIAAIAIFAYHPSMRSMGGMMIVFNVLPHLTLIWIVWLVATLVVRWPIRRYGLLWLFVLVWGYFGLVRMDGVDGTFASAMNFRWDPIAEDLHRTDLKARHAASSGQPGAEADEIGELEPADWPGFRGADRDGSRKGVRIATDWSAKPPRELWRHRVGPGWSSFAIVGNRAYTQEQWDESEVVVCYNASSGEEMWVHRDQTRFSEALAGPGPRATPTYHEGKIYAQGAAGLLNCLDAATGRLVWSRDLLQESEAKLPMWGFSASPLVAGGIVSVFAGGPQGKSVLGFDANSGEPAWSAGMGEFSYCSTQLSRLAGVDQLLISTEKGVTSFDPEHGTVLWQHDWPLEGMARVVQPAVVGSSDVLIGTGFGNGTRRVRVSREADAWTTKEIWWSRAFKPYYNDLVVHRNHLYGFDSGFFVCVDLETGKVKWKTRGYGNGEVLLLADQGLLLVLSEQGDVALLDATPDRHIELCRIQAIKGKTWNHPVVARGKLFVRNGEEAACYELTELEEEKSEL